MGARAGWRAGRLRDLARTFAADIPVTRLRQRVEELPGPRSRLHYPAGMDAAEAVIADWLTGAGASVDHRPFTATDVLGSRDHGPTGMVRYRRLDGVNIVGLLPGHGSSRDAIVVLAHYDTVRDSPGANDNAASVVAIIEVARILAGLRLPWTVVFAATDLEEVGFFGGHALVESLRTVDRLDVRLAVNFECLAYSSNEPRSQVLPPGLDLLYPYQLSRVRRRGLRGDFTVLIHDRSAARPARLLRQVLGGLSPQAAPVTLVDPGGLPLLGPVLRRKVPAIRHFRRSDHVAFWDRGLPAIQVTDTADMRYPDYHLPSDTAEKLDYARVRDIAAATAATVAHLAGYRPIQTAVPTSEV